MSSQNLVEHLKFDEVRSADSKLKRIMEHRFMSAPQVGPSKAVEEYLDRPAAVKYLEEQKDHDNKAKKEKRGIGRGKGAKIVYMPSHLEAIGEHLDSLGVKNGDNIIHVTTFAKYIKVKESEQAAAKPGGIDRLEDMSVKQVALKVESIKKPVQYVDEEEDEEDDTIKSPKDYIGCKVTKKFSGKLYDGECDSYKKPYWKIVFDDGDEEEFEEEELKEAIRLYEGRAKKVATKK